MKNFAHYLAESERTYDYRIKLCGDVTTEFVRQLKSKFDQFDPVRMSDVKTTPIQKIPTDFPNFNNEKVNMIDVSFRYPAIEPQIKQLAQLLGLDPNRIVMNTTPYEESMDTESVKIEDENKDLINDPTYPAPDAEQKALSKDYATGPYEIGRAHV